MARTRWFWLILLGVVIAAAVPRLLIYDFSLPYIDHPDEGTSYLEARQWRGQYELGGGHEGYPPGHIALNYVTQNIVEGIGSGGIADSIRAMRLLSVAFNLLTLVVIALLARLMAGDVAGIVAAITWGVSPMVITNNVIAIPDPFLYLLTTLSVYLAAVAFAIPEKRYWCVWSFGVGLLAVVTKYPAFPVLIPAGLVALWEMRRNWRQGGRYLLIEAIGAGLVAAWLIFGYGAFDAFGVNRETVAMQQSGLSNVLSLPVVLHNIGAAWMPFHTLSAIVFGVLAVVVWVIVRNDDEHRANLTPLAAMIPALVLMPWVASSYAIVDASLIRHVMPVSSLAAVFVGVSVAQVAQIVKGRTQQALTVGVIAVLIGWVWWPQVMTLTRIIPTYRLPDTRVDLRLWADLNLEAGTVVVNIDNHKTFNPFWGGIEARQWFDWWEVDDFMVYPLDEWRNERGMSYMAIPLYKQTEMQATDDGQAYLDEMLLLRTFDDPNTRGPQMAFYRLWRMTHETDISFGDAIRLVGYDAPDTDNISAGESVALRFYWQADTVPATNYSVYMHLTPTDSREVLAQLDGAPTVPERPTMTWTHPDETLISPLLTFTLPDDLPAGEYRLLMGLYNFETFERLPVDVGDLGDGYELLRFTVD